MINIDIRSIAEQLGLWHGTQWMLFFPVWALLIVPLILSVGLVLAARICVEWSSPKLHLQYKGLWPGDVFASFGIGLLIVGLVFYASPVVSPFWRSGLWDTLTFLVSVGGTFLFALFEYVTAFRNRNKSYYDRDDHAYTLYQLHTPTALAHRLAMFVLLYLLMKVGMPALFTAAVPLTLKLSALVLFTAWGICIWLDNSKSKPRPNLGDVHPTSRAWFGIGRRRKPVSLHSVSPAGSTTYVEADSIDEPLARRSWDSMAFRRDDVDRFERTYGQTTGYPAAPLGDTRVGDFDRGTGGYRPDDAPYQPPRPAAEEGIPRRWDARPGNRTTSLRPFTPIDEPPTAPGEQTESRRGQDRTRIRPSSPGNDPDDGKLLPFKPI